MIYKNKVFIFVFFILAIAIVLVSTGRFFPAALTETSVTVFSCSTDSDCGTNGLTGTPVCQGNDVYQNFTTHTCNNPGTLFTSCASSSEPKLQFSCASNQTCSNGNCLAAITGGSGANIFYYPTVLTPAGVTPELAVEDLPSPSPTQITETPIIKSPKSDPKISFTQETPVDSIVSPNLLPFAIANLSAKIPEFANILFNLNVNNAKDVDNLRNYNIFLPGLKKITGASGADLPNFLPSQKASLPTDLVFVSLGRGNIDALTSLDFSENAPALEKINVPIRKLMRLIVKPSLRAKHVSGYILFDTDLKQKFSVLEFNYNDADKDGIFSADISAPAVEGRYQIVTSINYSAGNKEIKTTTLVDPDGYIYEKSGDKEIRLSNAIVSLYRLNNKNEYELWSAENYGQENPQITDKTGNYSFLVPEGTYYLTATANDYNPYMGDAIFVKEGKEFHSNIMLEKRFNLYSFLDWNTIMITILFCFVGYNFYLDRRKNLSIIKK